MKQRLKTGEQRHKKSRPARAAKPLQFLRQLRFQPELMGGATIALRRRARAVGREIDHGQFSSQSMLPVGPGLLSFRASQHFRLPARKVGVIKRESLKLGPQSAPDSGIYLS